MAKKDTILNDDSDPYVDMEPTFEQTMEIVENVPETLESQVSMKKIFFLLFLLLIIIMGGLSGVYFLFYGNSTEHIADNWNPPVIPEKVEPQLPPTPSEPEVLTMSTIAKSLTDISNQKSITALETIQSQTINISDEQLSDVTSPPLATGYTTDAQESLNAISVSETLTPSQEVTRTTAFNDLEPITPGLRSEPVVYRFKVIDDSEGITPNEDTDDIFSSDEDTDEDVDEESDKVVEASDNTTETSDITKATATSVTETEVETTEEKSKELAAIQEPLGKRKKPIVYRATIPLILMYPELTLNFNSFLLLLPDKPSKTYINIGIALKTSNESVFKEIQDRKTFVRGAIFGILKRLFESTPVTEISGESIKKRLKKEINYILITGTVDDVYITNYLSI